MKTNKSTLKERDQIMLNLYLTKMLDYMYTFCKEYEVKCFIDADTFKKSFLNYIKESRSS